MWGSFGEWQRSHGWVFTTVVFHSLVWMHLPMDVRAQTTEVIEEAATSATRDAPLAWLSLEPEGDPREGRGPLMLRTWPGDGDAQVLARCSFHHGPVEWLRPPSG